MSKPANKVMIDGTIYQINNGKKLINGTIYTIPSRKILVDGTVRIINTSIKQDGAETSQGEEE